jgi:hypothetical protein
MMSILFLPRRSALSASILCLLAAVLMLPAASRACTTLVIAPAASADGAPMLWKNRDTDTLDNKVLFVREAPYSYLGLVNAEDTSGRWVYAGLNSAGFAIFNTVAYNLPEDEGMKDLEGLVMADALRTCATVEEFGAWLDRNKGRNLGCWTNFGVLDASGKAWLFEVHNKGFIKKDAAGDPSGRLVNTNFSRSGNEGAGAGYLRFDRAHQILDGFKGARLTPEIIFTALARDTGHVWLHSPTLMDLASLSGKEPRWIMALHTINRGDTSAAVVIQGRSKDRPATFWVALGEPVCAIAIPLWVEAGDSPALLYTGEKSALNLESRRLSARLHPNREKDKMDYMNLSPLQNAEGTGFWPVIENAEVAIRLETGRFLKQKRSPEELRAFQARMAEKALAALKSIP